MSYDKPSVVLAELWERTSAKGNTYYLGFMGSVSVALLRDGERPHPTRPGETVVVWKLLAQERAAPPRKAPHERGPPPGRVPAPTSQAAHSEAPQRPALRREGAKARQERVSAEIARGYGVESNEDLSDPIPF
jgi:hypothetical protein